MEYRSASYIKDGKIHNKSEANQKECEMSIGSAECTWTSELV
jgi:hypothetical protein